MEYKLVLYPDPILETKCEPVKLPLSKEDKELLDAMYNYIKQPDNAGIGLAAPQFGVAKRMIAVRLNFKNLKLFLKLVNPTMIITDKTKYYKEHGEACLSEPGFEIKVPRAKKIMLFGYDDITKSNIKMRLEGYAAAVIQHEMDHLNGILLHHYKKESNDESNSD